MSFEDLKKGDKITRMLAGVVPMAMTVVVVEGDVIKCTCDGFITDPKATNQLSTTWHFNTKSGAEIDHDMQWGPQYGVTGSYLVRAQ